MRPLVSPEDKHLLDQRWGQMKGGYWRRNVRVGEKKVQLLLHRVVMNAQPGQSVDHINGDVNDNRRENLRVCSHAENMRNMKLKVNSTTGYKGVTRRKYNGRNPYAAYIKVNATQIHLGYYATPELAAVAYDDAATKHFGEFARLNFPRVEVRNAAD